MSFNYNPTWSWSWFKIKMFTKLDFSEIQGVPYWTFFFPMMIRGVGTIISPACEIYWIIMVNLMQLKSLACWLLISILPRLVQHVGTSHFKFWDPQKSPKNFCWMLSFSRKLLLSQLPNLKKSYPLKYLDLSERKMQHDMWHGSASSQPSSASKLRTKRCVYTHIYIYIHIYIHIHIHIYILCITWVHPPRCNTGKWSLVLAPS